jgi:hypothetical protein
MKKNVSLKGLVVAGVLSGSLVAMSSQAFAQQYVMKIKMNGLEEETKIELVNGAYQYNKGTYAQTCQEYLENGGTADAKYRVDTNQDGNPETVDCLMTVHSGGWTCNGYEIRARMSDSSGGTRSGNYSPNIPSWAGQAMTRNLNYRYGYSSDNDTFSYYVEVGSYRWGTYSSNKSTSTITTVNSLDTSVYGYIRDTEGNDSIKLYFDAEYCFR